MRVPDDSSMSFEIVTVYDTWDAAVGELSVIIRTGHLDRNRGRN